MKKKIKNLHFGFSVAELLISMLVVMIVAAAMVPIVGPKKVKIPNVRKSHGVFECYFSDADGHLVQYYADNGTHRNGSLSAAESQEYCEFNVPAADRYDVYAIGAGSDGFRGDEAGNGIGYDILNTAGRSGIIRLSHFHEDIGSASTNAVQDQGITTSLQSEIRTLFNQWRQKRIDAGADLYAIFTNLKSPLSAGGRGNSQQIIGTHKISYDGQDIVCSTACRNGSLACRGPYTQEGHYFNSTDESDDIINNAKLAGMCYWYVHGSGSDSAMGRVSNPGDVFLVPLHAGGVSDDGFVYSASAFQVTFNNDSHKTAANISTTVYNGKNPQSASLTLRAKLSGNDAVYDQVTHQMRDGAKPLEGSPQDVLQDPNHLIKIAKNGAARADLNLDDIPFKNDHRRRASTHGIETGMGLLNGTDNQQAIAGSADFTDNAFQWQYTALNVNYTYGTAGEPGDINLMSYNNLHGKLYLYPGYSRNGTVVDTVVSKEAARNNKKSYIVTAASKPILNTNTGRGVPVTRQMLLTDEIMPTPPEEIRMAASADADNARFNVIISKINSSGFSGGLYNCNLNGFCPGYAGSGAYPFVNFADGTNTLTLTDLQNNAKYNNGSISRNFRVEMPAAQAKRCPDGSEVLFKGKKTWYDTKGKPHEYDDEICRASIDKRRDGAVVIVW